MEDIFKEETAGTSEHSVELFAASSASFDEEISGSLHQLRWKYGCYRPCDRVPRQLFIAAAPEDLVSDGSGLPNLVLYHSSAVVPV